MSLNAYVWAGQLPLDITSATAFRVLLKMADVADADGRGVWLTTSRMAEELGCSVRTVQRAVKELQLAGLIHEGDKRAVAHIRSDRRPTVYDLNMTAETAPQIDLDGVTKMSSHGVTKMSRGDKSVHNGVTTVVAHRTVTKPLNSPESVNHRAPSFQSIATPPRTITKPDILAPCTNHDGHAFKRGVCQHCNTAREHLRDQASA